MMNMPTTRKGGRRLVDVPPEVRDALARGETECVNLMEWLAADLSALANTVANELGRGPLAQALNIASEEAVGKSITCRLQVLGDAIAKAGLVADDPEFRHLTLHRSDLVRQWACYAVNSRHYGSGEWSGVKARILSSLRFASDPNMTVRETAWMAARPHVASDLEAALPILATLVRHDDPRVRRFAVEVSRPRSVWGEHIVELKRRPEAAGPVLAAVRSDKSQYVRLAVGNWLNDASKSRPDWVWDTCAKWLQQPTPETIATVKRGLRNLMKRKGASGELLDQQESPAVLNVIRNWS